MKIDNSKEEENFEVENIKSNINLNKEDVSNSNNNRDINNINDLKENEKVKKNKKKKNIKMNMEELGMFHLIMIKN